MRHTLFVLMIVGMLIIAGCVSPPASGATGASNATGASGQQAGAGTSGGTGAASGTGAGSETGQGTTTTPSGGGTGSTGQGTTSPPATTGTQMPAGERISMTTDDSWKINGTLYKAQNSPPKTGIILIPQLGADRSSYDALVPVLHDALPDADIIAYDPRGVGESTNLGKQSSFSGGDYKTMTKDVQAAVKYLGFMRQMPNNYYLVGASIGSSTAINYAVGDSAVQKIVMISPNTDYEGVDTTIALGKVKKEVYFVAAQGDTQADAQTSYADSKAYVKELFIYKTIGSAHGTDMFAASESSSEGALTEKIADWLK